jgi:hypothetical protein
MKLRSLPLLALLACAPACSSTKSSAPEMTPEQQMAAWEKHMTPGPNHQLLAPMAGTYRVSVKSRMAADAPWEESTGSCENRWIFGNRFLESSFRGAFAGMPFEGRGLFGYDNTTQKFVGFWTDSMTTGLMPIAQGSADATGKVITLRREMTDPMSGQWSKMREVWTIESPTSHKCDMYCQTGDDPEYHMMTLAFTR